jgi:hypothetical protein
LGAPGPTNINQCCTGLLAVVPFNQPAGTIGPICQKKAANLKDINADKVIDGADQRIYDIWNNWKTIGACDIANGTNGNGNHLPDGDCNYGDEQLVKQFLTDSAAHDYPYSGQWDFNSDMAFDQKDIDIYKICRPNPSDPACATGVNLTKVKNVIDYGGVSNSPINSSLFPSMIKKFDWNGDGKVTSQITGPIKDSDVALFRQCMQFNLCNP